MARRRVELSGIETVVVEQEGAIGLEPGWTFAKRLLRSVGRRIGSWDGAGEASRPAIRRRRAGPKTRLRLRGSTMHRVFSQPRRSKSEPGVRDGRPQPREYPARTYSSPLLNGEDACIPGPTRSMTATKLAHWSPAPAACRRTLGDCTHECIQRPGHPLSFISGQ